MSDLVFLYSANEADLDFFYKVRTDPEVMLNSINSEPISYANHARWFANVITPRFTIRLMPNRDRIGTATISLENAGELSVSLLPEYRGRGCGSQAIAQLVGRCLDLGLEPFARIKWDNAASIKAFQKSGVRIEYV